MGSYPSSDMCFPTLSVFYTSGNKLSAQLLLLHLAHSKILWKKPETTTIIVIIIIIIIL